MALNTTDHNGKQFYMGLQCFSDASFYYYIGREGDSIRVIDEKALEQAKRWDGLSITEKLGDWAARRQYSIIIGGWATSLGVAAAIISRNKYQTFSQKVLSVDMRQKSILPFF